MGLLGLFCGSQFKNKRKEKNIEVPVLMNGIVATEALYVKCGVAESWPGADDVIVDRLYVGLELLLSHCLHIFEATA